MYRCLHGLAPRYLADQLTPASNVPSWLRLRPANRYQLIVPSCRLNTYGRRAFLIAGPTVWNSLPRACGFDSFKQFLKTILFSLYWCGQRIRGFLKWYALYKFTYLYYAYWREDYDCNTHNVVFLGWKLVPPNRVTSVQGYENMDAECWTNGEILLLASTRRSVFARRPHHKMHS